MATYNGTIINGYSLNIEMINAVTNAELAAEYNVGGFPTIILTKDAINTIYNGDNTKEAYYNYVNELIHFATQNKVK